MILITGWTGNTGSFVIDRVKKKYPDIKIVGVSRTVPLENPHTVISEAIDLNEEEKFKALFKKYKFKTIIHIANIRYSPLILKLADENQVPNTILVHTTGIYSKYRAYSSLYLQIEDGILSENYPCTSYTILRPTMIYGNRRDHNMHKLIIFLSKSPVFPLFGSGDSLMQPVHVEDLAEAIVSCLDNDLVKNKAYDLSGGTVISYKEVLRTITTLLEKRVLFFHLPISVVIRATKLYNNLFKRAIISVEQVERLQEDKVYSHTPATIDIGYHPRSFQEGIQQEIKLLRNEGLIP